MLNMQRRYSEQEAVSDDVLLIIMRSIENTTIIY